MLSKINGQCTLMISFQIGLIQAQLQSLAENENQGICAHGAKHERYERTLGTLSLPHLHHTDLRGFL